MEFSEDRLSALELQCSEITQVLATPSSTGPLHEYVQPGFLGEVNLLVEAYRLERAKPIPVDQSATVQRLNGALTLAYGLLEKIARMQTLKGNREAALAAQSFLDAHPLSK